MATQEQTKQIALQESILYTNCEELYVKVLDSLVGLGWKELWISAGGDAVYSRTINGQEYILIIDMFSVLVKEAPTDEPPAFTFAGKPDVYEPTEIANRLRWEIEALPEWEVLKEPVQVWLEYRKKYWHI